MVFLIFACPEEIVGFRVFFTIILAVLESSIGAAAFRISVKSRRLLGVGVSDLLEIFRHEQRPIGKEARSVVFALDQSCGCAVVVFCSDVRT